MDIGVLNSLGYIEVIEISIWLGIMYYGKCWIDYKFKQGDNEGQIKSGKVFKYNTYRIFGNDF